MVGIGVENDPRIRADLDLARFERRQIDVDIDIGKVQHGEDLAAGWKNLTDIGQAILDASGFWRDQRIVGDLDLVEARIVFGCFQHMPGNQNPGIRRVKSGNRTIELLLTLIGDFLRGPAVLQKRAGAVHFLFRELSLCFLLDQVGLGFVDRTLGLLNLRFRF